MRAVVQRVSEAAVTVDGAEIARIGTGLLVYAGVAAGDEIKDADYLAAKIRYLRIFQDAAGKMNLDVQQAGGAVLLVSNFTLLADASQGRRPAFTGAAPPAAAEALFDDLCGKIAALGVPVQKGRFGAMMRVAAANDGPINILLDSRATPEDR